MYKCINVLGVLLRQETERFIKYMMSINQSKNMPFDIFGKIVFINEYLNGGETANKSFFKKALRLKKKVFPFEKK